MSKKNDCTSKPPPIELWKNSPSIQEAVEEIDFITKEVFPTGKDTNVLLGISTIDDPFKNLFTGLTRLGHVRGDRYLYRQDNSDEWGLFKDSLDLNDDTSVIKWICPVVPPNWGADISSDILVYITSYLPIDKIFIVAGLCKRFRDICFGRPGFGGRLQHGGIQWHKYLSFIANKPIPPRFPRSVTPFSTASRLSTTDLSKWGRPMMNTMRRKIAKPAKWPSLEFLNEGGVLPPLLKNGMLGQIIHVMIGDMGVCIPVEVDASITPEVLKRHLRRQPTLKRVSDQALMEFTIQCPEEDVLKTLNDEQFKWMGLDPPTRNQESGEIVSLPLRPAMIPWVPKVPIHFYQATVGWRVQVKIYERRSMKDQNNESLRQTIIQRFTENRFCKHCYRWMDFKETKCVVPKEWIKLVPNIAPICIHCFTHMFRDDISAPRGLNDPNGVVKCPSCTDVIISERRRYHFLGQDNFYKCHKCDGPELHFAFVRKEVFFAPHTEAWKKLCVNQVPEDTPVMKKFKEAQKRKRIDSLKLSIESNLEGIRKSQFELEELGVDDYTKIQVMEPEIKKLKLAFKRPAEKGPRHPAKRPMMSPIVPRVSGKSPKILEVDDDDEDDDYFIAI